MNRTSLTTLLPALLLLLATSAVQALEKPHPSVHPPKYDEVLKAGGPQALVEVMDRIHFGWKTMIVDSTLSVHEPGEAKGREAHVLMWQDGGKRLIRIVGPPEVKGLGVLIKGDTTYVYVPEFDKVRRIATHAKKQTLLGSDFSYEDMSMGALSPDYDATLEKETAEQVILSLTKKSGSEVVYPKLRLFMDKKTCQMMKQEYFDADGRLLRTQIREGMTTFDHPEYGVQHIVKLIDHTNHDHWTQLTMSKFIADEEIPARFFSKRTLVRGE